MQYNSHKEANILTAEMFLAFKKEVEKESKSELPVDRYVSFCILFAKKMMEDRMDTSNDAHLLSWLGATSFSIILWLIDIISLEREKNN